MKFILRQFIMLKMAYLLCLLFLFSGCKQYVEIDPYLPIHDFSFKEGDIVFRQGQGVVSRAVLYADVDGVYSHLGIVVNDSGIMKVIHAVPGEPEFKDDIDKVKMETIDKFFSKTNASHGCVMRGADDSITYLRIAEKAKHIFRRNTLFDHDYDHSDTLKMYCTELIHYVYMSQGIDLVETRMQNLNLPGFSGTYILPSGILESPYLSEMYNF